MLLSEEEAPVPSAPAADDGIYPSAEVFVEAGTPGVYHRGTVVATSGETVRCRPELLSADQHYSTHLL